MNEAETRAELIDPALAAAGWGLVEDSRILREHEITLGRLEGGRGRRAKGDIADYVLVYRGVKLAVIEAKARDLEVTEGLAQAKRYATKLALTWTYSTNGRGIHEADMHTGIEGPVTAYPSPETLWGRVFAKANAWRDKFAAVPYPDKSGSWSLRFYQEIAVNRVLESLGAGTRRALLTLATGTGKTSIAFQIAWKIFSARWTLAGDGARRPRILFLADRNTLANQAFNDFNAFASFEEAALVRIRPDAIRKTGKPPTNGAMFFTIFQTFMSGPGDTPYFGEYPKDFFDLIIIDECHRGGANDQGEWRAILEYFSPAAQLGLTATPKRKDNVDTYAYFGEPLHTYSLKEGINDGFLTPFRVVQYATTLDEYVHTADNLVMEGAVPVGRRFEEREFNRDIVIDEREEYRVKLWLNRINPDEKTLVFCAQQPHPLLVRDLINKHKQRTHPDYCVRVTADDGEIGEQFLRAFQDNEKVIPTILTTAQKLSTGVDARNVRNIVLMRPVTSMIEFKQIIGRGTRLYDGKDFFTIHDFVGAHRKFSDREWDGEPDPPMQPGTMRPGGSIGLGISGVGPVSPPTPPPAKAKVKLADGKERTIQSMFVLTYWHPDGTPISAKQFIELLYGKLPALFQDEADLRTRWGEPMTRAALLISLGEQGFGLDQLAEMARVIDAEHGEIFDVLAHVAFGTPPLSRAERAERAEIALDGQYPAKLTGFLKFVLSQYVKSGVEELDPAKLPALLSLRYNHAIADSRELGSPQAIREAFAGFQQALYK